LQSSEKYIEIIKEKLLEIYYLRKRYILRNVCDKRQQGNPSLKDSLSRPTKSVAITNSLEFHSTGKLEAVFTRRIRSRMFIFPFSIKQFEDSDNYHSLFDFVVTRPGCTIMKERKPWDKIISRTEGRTEWRILYNEKFFHKSATQMEMMKQTMKF
jgi:hypothetical protein